MIIHYDDHGVTLNDEWLIAAGAMNFAPHRPSYIADLVSSNDRSFQIVKINEIAPVRRAPGVEYFNECPLEFLTAEQRTCRILRAFVEGAALPAIKVAEFSTGSYRFKLKDGMHRLLLSLAVGFTHIPTVTIEDFEFEVPALKVR